ncbi:MarR family transcriptional regulator [Natrarchaeobaculum sulfurireducens]|uniref:Transcriptional regulator, contains HTH domain n=1 Tax=Natrarchaeobaculum sulfurireducens TaxID=2044521 RepID=A0A346PGE2_9EURY|nr:MarR family transcriptional regulator [Natrarchaeobaculum sulfurireducens]AXR78587.1 Transcriptional regulator, contains HTH domain [Natrarchaeobaculum sulfurireducens]AXR81362.1 hypothetical protein AArcMg_1346 [Natrarchaeobaculum sulfurireducens]
MESKSRHRTATPIPDAIESPRAKLVYLYVTTRGETTAEQLRDDLGMRTGTTLTILRTLQERGYLERQDDRIVPLS